MSLRVLLRGFIGDTIDFGDVVIIRRNRLVVQYSCTTKQAVQLYSLFPLHVHAAPVDPWIFVLRSALVNPWMYAA
jgi:hypothetical protein